MLRFLIGLTLTQAVAMALFYVNADAQPRELLLLVGLPSAIVAVSTALWFSAFSRNEADRRNASAAEKHAREREKLKLELMHAQEHAQVEVLMDRERVQRDARREQDKAVERVRREAEKRERRSGRAASLKMAMMFVGATAVGVLMLLTELLTLGLLTISTSAGALGGYMLRWRQTRAMEGGTTPAISSGDDPRVVGESSLPAPEEGASEGKSEDKAAS